ncbi:MAG TPA: 3-keto-5-aminohexanoate cleavage protein [Candidatus Polarisedimenticolia bacterium]|nr:3-keto-5-aminohexanoate cleavage protein [Candidatus Polarisedimenticolia bacterium]
MLHQAKNPTMDKKLIITVCPVGALFSRKQNPHQPYTPEEIARETIESYQEGASVVHLHTRDEHGHPRSSWENLKKTIDLIMEKCPDIVIQPSACESYIPGKSDYSYETVKVMADKLHGYGRSYMESTIFTPVSYACEDVDGTIDLSLATRENAIKTIRYLQERHIKPEFMNHNWEGLRNVTEWLVEPGILEKPYLMSMGPGMHNAADTSPDPWGLMYLLGMMKMMPSGSVLSISAGGRDWLSLTTFAILLGVDNVRVGKEDHLWMYPHKDEIVRRNADETRKIAAIARELGRDIANPRDARSIMGIRET